MGEKIFNAVLYSFTIVFGWHLIGRPDLIFSDLLLIMIAIPTIQIRDLLNKKLDK